MKNTFPVFRAGNYPQGNYSADDVKELFEKYDPDFLSAPFTVDHKQDGPAFGYAKVLKFSNDTLFASSEDLAENMRNAVKDKHFNRVSVEIYKNLPDKGRYLKAISFLGVKAPQVKGMEGDMDQTDFQDAESESIEFEVNWDGDAFELAPATDEKGDKKDVVHDDKFEQYQAKIDNLEKEKKDLAAKFATSETERKQAKEKLEEIELNQRRLSFEQFLNDRLAYGSITPANKEKVMDILFALDSIEMFEHDGKEIKPLDLFKEFIEALPKVVDGEEAVTKDKNGSKLDLTSSKAIAKAAEEYQQTEADKGRTVSTAAAVTYVLNQNQ